MGPLKSGMEVTVLITHNSLQHRCEVGGVFVSNRRWKKTKNLLLKCETITLIKCYLDHS